MNLNDEWKMFLTLADKSRQIRAGTYHFDDASFENLSHHIQLWDAATALGIGSVMIRDLKNKQQMDIIEALRVNLEQAALFYVKTQIKLYGSSTPQTPVS